MKWLCTIRGNVLDIQKSEYIASVSKCVIVSVSFEQLSSDWDWDWEWEWGWVPQSQELTV